ncbi:hypothetical protein ABIA32_001543 [Streptacidiphilus sp. MAP12-20]|uniref:hypothetical protein n=1 Tax=Streptacidiphilus sp. MAP12-20 TaxID=3156299 RepID=UPI003519C080
MGQSSAPPGEVHLHWNSSPDDVTEQWNVQLLWGLAAVLGMVLKRIAESWKRHGAPSMPMSVGLATAVGVTSQIQSSPVLHGVIFAGVAWGIATVLWAAAKFSRCVRTWANTRRT